MRTKISALGESERTGPSVTEQVSPGIGIELKARSTKKINVK